MRHRQLALVLGLTCAAGPLTAQTSFSIGARASTLGFGAEVAKLVSPHLGVRVAAYRYSRSFSDTQSDVAYNVDLKFKGVSALVDLYPSARGSFHLTGGLLTAPAEVDGVGQPSGDTYDFNGTTYTAAQVGTVNGTVRWDDKMPYVGLGWGTPAARKGGLSFLFDLGVGLGKPTVGLTASSAVPGSTLAQDVEAERQDIQKDVDKYAKVYPVISFGLAWRF
jgi:hypothetical protein